MRPSTHTLLIGAIAAAGLALPAVTASAASAAPSAHVANFVTPKTLLTYSSLADSPEARFTLVLEVNGSGSFVSGLASSSRTVQLSQTQLTTLRGELSGAHFAKLNAKYDQLSQPVVGGAPDKITYQGKTVSVAVGATRPAALGKLITTLNAYVDAFYPSAASGSALVRYSGGLAIADGNFTLVMRSDGAGTFTRGTTTSAVLLTKGQLSRVQAVLTAARFATLRRVYRSKIHLRGPTPDVISYQGRTVSVEVGARRPARLGRVIQALAKIVGGFQLPLSGS